jgi:signal transduction histidine kinase/PAS domain-containing protein
MSNVTTHPDRRLGPSPSGDESRMLAALMAGTHEAVSFWERAEDASFRLVDANAAFMTAIGRRGQAIPVGRPIDEVIERLPPEGLALAQHVIDTGQPFTLEGYSVRSASGHKRWDITLTPLEGSVPPQVLVTVLDVTARTDAEEQLACSNGEMRDAADRATAALESIGGVARALAEDGGFDEVMASVAAGVRSAFGLDTVALVLNEADHIYEVRAAATAPGGPGPGAWFPEGAVEEGLDHPFEVSPDVFFVPHDHDGRAWWRRELPRAISDLGWEGPGTWHPHDACFVRLRTSRGHRVGLLWLGSAESRPLPTQPELRMISAYAAVAASVGEAALRARHVAAEQDERHMTALKQDLMEELMLHRHLVEIGGMLGGRSAATSPGAVFDLLAQRLREVLPIKSLTINRVDHQTRTYRPIYHSEPGPVAEAILRFEAPVGAGATGMAAETAQHVIENAGPDQAAVDVPGTPDDDEHLLATPVVIDERVRAVLTLRRSWRANPFTPADARRAELFSQHIAAAILLVELAEAGEELVGNRLVLAEQVKKLEALNRIKDEFIANVSHELRTPLTAVLGNLATVNGGADIPAEIREELLEAAERQARRLGELLENLLAASRLVGEEPAVVVEQIDVRSFLNEIAAVLRSRAPKRTISVRVRGTPVVQSDPTLLYRILYNLGDNALKYSDDRVSLAARVSDGRVHIDVTDRGVGIDAADLPRVFDRFQQLDAAATRRVGGVGLGLYLSSRLAIALGGHIDVRSEPGNGSTFTLMLPVQPQMSLMDSASDADSETLDRLTA